MKYIDYCWITYFSLQFCQFVLHGSCDPLIRCMHVYNCYNFGMNWSFYYKIYFSLLIIFILKSVLVFLYFHHKLPQIKLFKTTDIYSFIVLDIKSLKSKCQQNPLPFPTSGRCCQFWTYFGMDMYQSNLFLCNTWYFLYVSLQLSS